MTGKEFKHFRLMVAHDSQAKAAQILGVSQYAISLFERGGIKKLRRCHWMRLDNYLRRFGLNLKSFKS